MDRNILWIEDDYYHVSGLIQPLQEEGYKFKIARSYLEAKNYLVNWQEFSAIILDLIIPYSEEHLEDPGKGRGYDPIENGIKLFSYLIEEINVTIPIIILSIVANKERINKLLEQGATMCLYKGFILPEDLKLEIDKLIDKK
jgi:CheY-like chemotaxis protein